MSYKKLSLSINENKIVIKFEKKFCAKILQYIIELMIRNISVKKNSVFIHASSFYYKNKLHIFPAWGGIGKTNLLIHFLNDNAIFFGDDLIIINSDGTVYPYLKPVNLLYYNFETFPDLLNNFKKINKILLKSLKFFQIIKKYFKRSYLVYGLFNVLIRKLENRLNVQIPFYKISKNQKLYSKFNNFNIYNLEKTFDDNIHLYKPNLDSLSKKLSICMYWERNYFADLISAYIYAFPEQKKYFEDLFHKEEILVYHILKKLIM